MVSNVYGCEILRSIGTITGVHDSVLGCVSDPGCFAAGVLAERAPILARKLIQLLLLSSLCVVVESVFLLRGLVGAWVPC